MGAAEACPGGESGGICWAEVARADAGNDSLRRAKKMAADACGI